ncbi:MAG: hypothetical protein KGI84_05270 [Elusimicrobia bacterium]|nr:hypothetical protein [Elusimicrobiota bacterium]
MGKISRRFAQARAAISLALLAAFGGCASVPRLPAWTQEPARLVDNGYIVYLGEAQEFNPNQAQFAAEGMAIQDLANECSFVPKRARVENHYVADANGSFEGYATVAINYDACVQAQNAVDPAQIKALASAPFMEELKRYQDFIGSSPQLTSFASAQNPEASASASAAPAPAPPPVTDDVNFFFARQYVAYQKQIVILSPTYVYAPGSVAAKTYINNVTAVARPMRAYYVQHPQLRTTRTTWSTIEPRVRQRYPRAFKRPIHRVRRPFRPARRRWFQRRRRPVRHARVVRPRRPKRWRRRDY